MSRELGSLASSRSTERHGPRLPFAQINEDFMRLQIVNNDLLRTVSQSGVLDLTFVGKAASEIKKRAGRLKDNLVLPAPEGDFKSSQAEVGLQDEQLRSALLTLGHWIAGFAHNPIFKEANIVDVQLSAKARRDLEEIIKLSGQVKRSSERLNKAAQK